MTDISSYTEHNTKINGLSLANTLIHSGNECHWFWQIGHCGLFSFGVSVNRRSKEPLLSWNNSAVKTQTWKSKNDRQTLVCRSSIVLCIPCSFFSSAVSLCACGTLSSSRASPHLHRTMLAILHDALFNWHFSLFAYNKRKFSWPLEIHSLAVKNCSCSSVYGATQRKHTWQHSCGSEKCSWNGGVVAFM